MAEENALKLLAVYGNDGESSDEDVPGARVSTKRPYKEDNSISERLPVPECLKIKETSWIDDPSEHQGRMRRFEHERGNWATFVYLPYECENGLLTLLDRITKLVHPIELNKIDDFHISLTKTVVLKYHWIFPFMNTLKEYTSKYKRFIAIFGDFKIYCNEEKSRTFLGIEITSGYDTLHSLVKNLDKCLADFQLPQFYEDPSFHMSILWCLGDRQEELSQYLHHFNSILKEIRAEYCDENWYIVANYLFAKSGNKMFQFPLQ